MPPETEPIPPHDPGARLAADMVQALRALHDRVAEQTAMNTDLREAVDQLTAHFEVLGRTMEIICEKKDEGKSKFSLSDFAEAYVEAADEIMPAEDDGDEDDDDGDVRAGTG